jgi:hypothetical protein
VHMRSGGLVSYDYGKKMSEKKHAATAGGVVKPITTDIDLTKNTLFLAAASRFVSTELLLDKEEGTRVQKIDHPTRGNRETINDAESTYYGAILDFRFFGISYASADFSYLDEFRVGEVPDLTARDQDKKMNYTNLKIGSAIKIGVIRVGAYFLNQKASGDYAFTIYDPTTGLEGTTESFDVKQTTTGFGAGVGFTLPYLRSELSYEQLDNKKFDIADDYPGTVNKPHDSSRITLVTELRLRYFSFGMRFRNIKGNYIDLEDIISANILTDSIGPSDTRNETTFNFSLGDSKGFSPSLFYTQSEVTTNEKSPVFDNGLEYKAVTKTKAYGINLSYRF